ncbi:MAG TPA: VRR-NUC domain-containing protein [Pseudomonas sp.]|nr:VRR-NUC domain-containing protein [Pseudomonas sp.]
MPPELYYLSNFHKGLNWLVERYADLLDETERAFIERFTGLAQSSQALLVRMIMRKGPHFRTSRLEYPEIGCARDAAAPLLDAGWLDTRAGLSLPELFEQLRKDELTRHLPAARPHGRLKKNELLDLLTPQFPAPRPFADWCPELDEPLFSLTIDDLCERLRLMFFGNLRQDWSEFVLADLGIFRYECVDIGPESRGFRQRKDLDTYLAVQHCREAWEADQPLGEVLAPLQALDCANPYLARRRDKLRFQIAQQLERDAELEPALALYRECAYPGARQRRVRVLERLQRAEEAHVLALEAQRNPENQAELQLIERALVRLERQLGLGKRARSPEASVGCLDLSLPASAEGVELAVAGHLTAEGAPVYYVENSLVCGLFGLLCWEAIFAPVPGAFFHPFHSGPTDLYSPDFPSRRADVFERCLQRLNSDEYRAHIRQMYAAKQGIQSPFVHWGVLDTALLETALQCIPAAHIKAWCLRLLGDLRANRAGMPDLIQFWPAEDRYRMVEVKGPGDRLQDNQRRWLSFCAEHGMPVEVCYVQWTTP